MEKWYRGKRGENPCEGEAVRDSGGLCWAGRKGRIWVDLRKVSISFRIVTSQADGRRGPGLPVGWEVKWNLSWGLRMLSWKCFWLDSSTYLPTYQMLCVRESTLDSKVEDWSNWSIALGFLYTSLWSWPSNLPQPSSENAFAADDTVEIELHKHPLWERKQIRTVNLPCKIKEKDLNEENHLDLRYFCLFRFIQDYAVKCLSLCYFKFGSFWTKQRVVVRWFIEMKGKSQVRVNSQTLCLLFLMS